MPNKSPLFHMVAGFVNQQSRIYMAADNDTRASTPIPAPEARQRVTEAQLARAEAAARVVKMARLWHEHVAEGTEGTAEYNADANRLIESVQTYNALLGKGE